MFDPRILLEAVGAEISPIRTTTLLSMPFYSV